MIEHVGGREAQRRFVEEALRVARRAFVTTPNRWFPVEVHTRLPLVHWLPDRLAHPVYDLARKPWAKDNHLLGAGDLHELFPPEARIVNLGLTLVASLIERLPRWSLFAFVVALPLHNLVMAELWELGVRDLALDVVSAWKELLLALALGASSGASAASRSRPRRRTTSRSSTRPSCCCTP